MLMHPFLAWARQNPQSGQGRLEGPQCLLGKFKHGVVRERILLDRSDELETSFGFNAASKVNVFLGIFENLYLFYKRH